MLEFHELVAVVERGWWIMDRAGADDDKEAVIRPCHDGYGFCAAGEDGLFGARSLRDLMLKEVGRCERVVTTNW